MCSTDFIRGAEISLDLLVGLPQLDSVDSEDDQIDTGSPADLCGVHCGQPAWGGSLPAS